MARDKTDKTGTPPFATIATTATRDRAYKFAADFLNSNVLLSEIKNHQLTESEQEHMAIVLKQSLQHPDTNDFEVGVSLAADLLRTGQSLPDWLASFAADVLDGKQERPTKRGKDKYQNVARDYSIGRAVEEVASRFGLPKYTNNELSNKVTAARIVAEAAGVSVNVAIRACKKFGGGLNRK